MDPTDALQQAILAIIDENREDAAGYLEDLAEWLRKGGALPDVEAVVAEVFDVEFDDDDEAGEDEVPAETPAVGSPARRRTTVS